MAYLRSCIAFLEIAIVLAAGGWSAISLAVRLRRQGGYGLSDALSAGAIGGLVGAAVGAVACVLRDGSAQPGGGWLGAWAGRFAPMAGLGLLEGAAIGVAVAFALSRRSERGQGLPPDDPD